MRVKEEETTNEWKRRDEKIGKKEKKGRGTREDEKN